MENLVNELMNVSTPTLILTVGLPCSGKTTWAKEFARIRGASVVNPDAVRLGMYGKPFLEFMEDYVWAHVKTQIRANFIYGNKLVILDATNVSRKLRDTWVSENYVTLYKYFDTPKSICRDRAIRNHRNDLLPVIDRMANSLEPLDYIERKYAIE